MNDERHDTFDLDRARREYSRLGFTAESEDLGDAIDEHYEQLQCEYEERGELAGYPEAIGCVDCTRAAGLDPFDDDKLVQRKLVKLGPVVNARQDATQSYVLECGHTVI